MEAARPTQESIAPSGSGSAVEPRRLWVSGERYNVDYLFDRDKGIVLRRSVLPERGGTTAGIGRPCLRTFVTVYVLPDADVPYLQIGASQWPLDAQTEVVHQRRVGGLLSVLRVRRGQGPEVTARQPTMVGALFERYDPAHDRLDQLDHDFLADVAHIAGSPERKEFIMATKDPMAGPWETWDRS